jgi:hypothetical protein
MAMRGLIRVAMRRRRLLIGSALAIMVMALSASAVSASEPIRSLQPFPDFVLPNACHFPVKLHATTNRSRVTTFSDGHLRITGALKVRMTNLRNGHRVTINSSGPVTVRFLASGVVVDGRGVGFIALSISRREPGTYLLETRGQVVTDEFGNVVSIRGTTRNICSMIR